MICFFSPLHNFLSWNCESWNHCGSHTLWLISDRRSCMIRPFTGMNPSLPIIWNGFPQEVSSPSYLHLICCGIKKDEKEKYTCDTMDWDSTEGVGDKYTVFEWKCVAAFSYCGLAKTINGEKPACLFVYFTLLCLWKLLWMTAEESDFWLVEGHSLHVWLHARLPDRLG